MQAVFNSIAQSPTLQAISIIITLGGFGIFIFKLLWPTFIFVKTAIQQGIKRAYVQSLKRILRIVRLDAKDSRLIIIRLSEYLARLFIYMLVPVLLLVSSASTKENLKLFGVDRAEVHPLSSIEIAALLVLVFPLSGAIAWLALSPFIGILRYCYFLRRYVRRQIWINSA